MIKFAQGVPWWWIVVGIGMFGWFLIWMKTEQKFLKKNWFKLETIPRKDDPDLYSLNFATFTVAIIGLSVLAFLKILGS